ncbi:hypothetical protein [Natronobacterium gregoryi]|uniref:Uncharacterized protein n=2 Tax=Natronobacterium gregoryi TaxID=44930 RepID=L0ACE5_NATGS|nr:hypothetical protein [Natronobacterium gregoryi]AFZ71536.1 hypothetical protein Natgr_0278 [Natronobacterium gregoryi SP2]ELY66592.1 hypothetical protein C490_12507 [Natronobacterium gregoryi SP2]PLK21308.1 hypothetical protein CYV19_04530 [Natronobacterium gregoryi SP2]SFI82586.1 hypothetical protein SAMN05443661_106106 [Natronobacterium gregoryi]
MSGTDDSVGGYSLRRELLWAGLAIAAITIVGWLVVFDGLETGAPRVLSAQLGTPLVVGTWLVLAVLGVVGLYRWFRSGE